MIGLPTTMPDGRPTAWLRIDSHRAHARTRAIMAEADELVDYASIGFGHVFVIAADRLAELDNLPRYCRNSVRRVRRPKGEYVRALTSSTTTTRETST